MRFLEIVVKRGKMIKAILFDLDNTLIDFMTMKSKCCEAAVDAMIAAGLDVKRKKAMKVLFGLYKEYGIEHKEIFQKLLAKLKGRINYRIMAHGIFDYRKLKESYLAPYPNVVSTLMILKRKYKLAIISDAPRLNAWLRLVTMDIDKFFDVVVTSADVRKKKTHAAPFKAVLRLLKVRPEEALMVGDRIERDIKTAKMLGIKTCYARYGERYLSKKPVERGKSRADFEINDIKDLLNVKILK